MKRVAEFKVTHKNVLENLMPEDEIEAFTKSCVVNVLKDRDSKGRRVLIVSVGGKKQKTNPRKLSKTISLYKSFLFVYRKEEENKLITIFVVIDLKRYRSDFPQTKLSVTIKK